jgi:hypothetical protein
VKHLTRQRSNAASFKSGKVVLCSSASNDSAVFICGLITPFSTAATDCDGRLNPPFHFVWFSLGSRPAPDHHNPSLTPGPDFGVRLKAPISVDF